MTATLRFTLPKEEHEFEAATQGQAVRGVLGELDNWLRSELKYGYPQAGRKNALQDTRDQLRRLLEDAGVRIWD